jgi:undecaprenyl-diphosphatase
MLIWIILGFAVLQGILEWLPVSSSGQTVTLLITSLNIDADVAFSLSLWLHLGTLIAVCVKYRKELWLFINPNVKDEEIKKWRLFLLLSTIGTIIIGVPCYFLVDYLIESPDIGDYTMLVIGIALIITAAILFFSKKVNVEGEMIEEISKKKMMGSGLLQGFSIIPGISRSGITIGGLLFMNIEKKDAIKGSFLMSIPAVLGGFFLLLIDALIEGSSILPIPLWQMLIAILLTALIGYLTMELFIFIARKYNFAIICLILGIITIVFFFFRYL